MAIDFFVLRQVTQLIEQKLEEARKSVPKAYTAATDASGVFAGDVARAKAAAEPKDMTKTAAADVTGKARQQASTKVHSVIAGHLKAGRGVAVFLHKSPQFGDEHEGELERHFLIPHQGETYLVSGKKTHKVAAMSPGSHGFIGIMPHASGRRSVSPVGYIPAGHAAEEDIRTFDPEQVEKTGLGKNFKMRLRGMPQFH